MDRTIGATARRQRLSDEATERLTLTTATEMVAEHGLTVSLEHLSLEEIIRRAGVSRSSVYRRWPQRHLFFNDLLVELARGHELGFDLAGIEQAVTAVLHEHADRARTPQGRRTLAVELLRTSIEADFAGICHSAVYRTYLGIRATFAGLPDGPTRRAVADALAARESELHRARSEMYARLASIFAYRLKPPLEAPSGFDLVSRAAGAAMTGMLIAVEAEPSLLEQRTVMRAFDSELEADWSVPAHVVASAILAHLELDPDVDVDLDVLLELPRMLDGPIVGVRTGGHPARPDRPH